MGNRKNLIISIAIIGAVFFIELLGGFLSGSLALLSDAGHMLTDTLALSLALLAALFASQPATRKNTFGFFRLEILAALANGTLLSLIAIYIFYEAVQRLFSPTIIAINLMLPIAVVGLIANLLAAYILSRRAGESLNVRGAFLHVLSDTVSSLSVILGGAAIALTGWVLIDPILGCLIAILILRGAVLLILEAVNVLLEGVPKGIRLEEVSSVIMSIPEVEDLHDLHVWSIGSGINSLSAHLLIADTAADRVAEVLIRIDQLLKNKFNITHTTFQTECQSCPEGLICRLAMKEDKQHGHRH